MAIAQPTYPVTTSALVTHVGSYTDQVAAGIAAGTAQVGPFQINSGATLSVGSGGTTLPIVDGQSRTIWDVVGELSFTAAGAITVPAGTPPGWSAVIAVTTTGAFAPTVAKTNGSVFAEGGVALQFSGASGVWDRLYLYSVDGTNVDARVTRAWA